MIRFSLKCCREPKNETVFNLQLHVNEVKYLGTIITPDSIKPDPSKVKAIMEMEPPKDKAGIRHLFHNLA